MKKQIKLILIGMILATGIQAEESTEGNTLEELKKEAVIKVEEAATEEAKKQAVAEANVTYEKMKKDGAEFLDSAGEYISENYDESKEYLSKNYDESKKYVTKQYNDSNIEEKSKTWYEEFRVWLDPEKENIRKGE